MATSWIQFVQQMRSATTTLADRVALARAAPDRTLRPVLTRSDATLAAADEALIGIGIWPDPSHGAHSGICLNNKGAARHTGEAVPYNSVTDLALSEHPDLNQEWTCALGEDITPERFFARFRLVVEDASPDSCFGLIVFLARFNGVPGHEIPQKWCAYVRRWERGDVTSTGAPHVSYGALHNALAHSQFGSAWGEAWVTCLQFMLDALLDGAPPHALPEHAAWPDLARARALLDFERQLYEDSLAFAHRVQLRLPIDGAPDRYRLVDAYLGTEHVPLGSLKVFLRNDRHNAFLKSGYTLMGLHKPSEEGSGNDMTISLSPEAGLNLLDLWKHLEALEETAWQGLRPNDAPRKDMRHYPHGRTPAGPPAPNQPWFITYDETLVGAPRRLPNGQPGSRLDWDEVVEAVWQTYHPFRHLVTYGRGGVPLTLETCPPEHFDTPQVRAASKRLVIAHWHAPTRAHPAGAARASADDDLPFLRFTPTLKRYLAACIAHTGSSPVKLAELPDLDGFDFVEITGGFAVVSADGAYVVDDWRREPVDTEGIRREFEHACLRLALIRSMSHQVAALYDDIEHYLEEGLHRRNPVGLLNRLTGMKLEVARRWTETMPQSFDPRTQALRNTLDARWGIAGRLESFYDSVDRVKALVDSYIQLRTNRRIAFLTMYGFPLLLAAGFFSFVFADLERNPATGLLEWPSLHWPAAVLYLVLAIGGMVAIRAATYLEDRAERVKHLPGEIRTAQENTDPASGAPPAPAPTSASNTATRSSSSR